LEQGRFGFGGSARFAGLIEEWGSRFKDQKQGLFMGRSLYNPLLNIGLEDSRHMLTIAGSRAGKGTTSIIPNLLLWEGSTLVVDPKGTNAAVTARRRRNMGQDVYIVDPFNILEDEESASFNPLEYLDPESPTIREQINIITEALVVPDQHQRERHWDDGAKTVIAGMIAHLVSSPQYKRPTLSMLRDLISALPDEQVSLWADMSLNEGAGRLAKDAANRIIQGIGTNEISSIISNADKHTEW
jgi:type IV secretory pathway TraG/TraD family ATPase VirD4